VVTATQLHALDFVLPKKLEARVPPEARGLRRDEVRLMVSHRAGDSKPSNLQASDTIPVAITSAK